jgi:hypothetical protein
MLLQDLLEEVVNANPDIDPDLFESFDLGGGALVVRCFEPLIYFGNRELWSRAGILFESQQKNYWDSHEIVNILTRSRRFTVVANLAAGKGIHGLISDLIEESM